MAWRQAYSLAILKRQIDELWPLRSKASDGTIGDAAHQAEDSDHNPRTFPGWGSEIVTARDITHDPKHGADMNDVANSLAESRDLRIKYIIWNRRILLSYGSKAWQWQQYTGDDPHTNHLHLSVVGTSKSDSALEWKLGGVEDMNKAQNDALAETWASQTAMRDGTRVGKVDTNPGGPHWVVTRLQEIGSDMAAVKATVADFTTQPAPILDYDLLAQALLRNIANPK